MIRSLVYMKYAAKALAKVFGKSLANAQGWPEYAVEIPIDLAWEWGERLYNDFKGHLTTEQVREAHAEVVKAGPDYSEAELIEAVNAGFLDAPESVRMTALALLGQIQWQSRQSLKRSEDPTGTTLPATLRFDSIEDLAALLPNDLPRYKVGDRPIQGFELAERLGVGGFGEVWKAHNPKRPGLAVALKFFTDANARDWLASHEADVLVRVQSEVRHPGIVRLLNVYEDLACLQFEYVKGWTLHQQILDWHALGKPDVPFIASEFQKIVEILVDVHQIQPKPIVHRDLKPANILVEMTSGGAVRYRITDFGIGGFVATEAARKSRIGETYSSQRNPSRLRGAHSPLYASPEQTRGGDPDPRDDVFSLGVLWYQMQTGRLDSGPPTGFDWSDELQKGRGMSQGMVRLMASCFSSEVEKRPVSAKVLVERLNALLAARPAVKPVPAEPRIEVVPPRPKVEKVSDLAVRSEVKPAEPRIEVVPPRPKVEKTLDRHVGIGDAQAVEVVPPQPKVAKAHDILTTKTALIPLKLIPTGTFMMGSPDGKGCDDERPQHKVTISSPFYMGIYPVTQAQYAKLMGKNPSWFAATGGGKDQIAGMDTSRLPVEQVAWFEAALFCNALSKAEGLDLAYRIDGENVAMSGGKGFRLPTEAEWEYACRAGRSSDFGFDGGERELPGYAWFDQNSGQRTHPVGEAKANGFGLHDMHGNVWEWCGDGYEADYYDRSAQVAPLGPSQTAAQVIRGGGWNGIAESCRSAYRVWGAPVVRRSGLGFRIALGRQEPERTLTYRKSEVKPAEPRIEVVPPRPEVTKAADVATRSVNKRTKVRNKFPFGIRYKSQPQDK
jgi:formylglycine-generating enzyme required for sulfatase activity